METTQMTEKLNQVITPQQLLTHWQGHRALTRRVIEAFPEDKLSDYTIGGMRPFIGLIAELIDLAEGGVEGLATGNWKSAEEWGHVTGNGPKTKEELLAKWDEVTEKINLFFPQITEDNFQDSVLAFGQYEGTVISMILYFIDNENHHRGQSYVYLRSLGINPPFFWER
ncbi:DinB family protein [Desertivirga arenae]|uniref:DinB family protein n=1 Tax=Desertivirga arenae TaxID=2810309 RepID=UPI001F603103|nr:DinB family protein [Pedobacter sp. SYSU D00823]